ncbi:MAG: substrate-binding domain-containing protein [Clostridiales bacterium]|jgi:simple sugar transport system substrate-binding protein|nr:substrate-binding domain-containing protein [Clostridiales bacterium]
MKNWKRYLSAVLIALLTVVMFAGASVAEETKGHILFVPSHQGAYMIRAWDLAQEYAQSKGYTIELQGPVALDPVGVANTLTDCLSKDVDILVTTSTDPVTLSTVLRQWQEKGTTIVTWDLDCDDPAARDAYAGICDLNLLGNFIVDDMVAFMGTDEFEYAIITSELTSAFLTQRVQQIQDYAAERYPNLKCVTVEASEGDTQRALEVTQNILTAYPNIKAIIGNSQELDAPVCQSIISADMVGGVYYFGHGTPNSSKPYFEMGVIGCISMWDPGEWGAWAAAVGIALFEGETFEDGPLPFFAELFPQAEKVGDQYYYWQKFTFTKDNVGQFNF